MPLARTTGYWVAKLGHARHEWEDGIAFSEGRGRLAVADGASSSFDAQRWARHLVEGFVRDPPRTLDHEAFDGWVADAVERWDAEDAPDAGTDVPGQDPEAPDGTPWYVEEAAVRGAFATFVGVQTADADDEVVWRCHAVGDSCLLHLRDDALEQAFPLDDGAAFDTTPDLLSSVAFSGDHGARHVHVATGSARPGDWLVLASDGLAAWALERGRHDDDVWRALVGLDADNLLGVLDEARREGEMTNDDVSLVRTAVVASP